MTDQMVVTADIPLGDPGRGQYAYRVGDKVPAKDVKDNGWHDYVASPKSKAGQEAVATAAGDAKPTDTPKGS